MTTAYASIVRLFLFFYHGLMALMKFGYRTLLIHHKLILSL